MSIKKISFLSAVSLAVVGSTVAFAGGPDAMAAPAPAAAPTVCQDLSSMFSPAFYIDADGGYAFQNWGQYINNMPIMVTAVARRYLMRAFSSFLISVLSLAVFICLK